MDSCIILNDFIRQEKKTLQYLKTKRKNSTLNNLAIAAERASISEALGMNAYFNWIAPHNDVCDDLLTIHVGGEILCEKNAINSFSYYFAISKEHEKCPHKILRKYHFDYTSKINPRREPHPLFHLQLPGKLSKDMNAIRCDIEHLSPDIRIPRIPYFPMSLALVLHLAFWEFKDDDTKGIREDGAWLNIVRENERALWKKYMDICVTMIANNQLISEEVYRT